MKERKRERDGGWTDAVATEKGGQPFEGATTGTLGLSARARQPCEKSATGECASGRDVG